MSKQRILFVDDEPNIIAGLRRMLRRQQNEWEVEFANSGQEALAMLAQTPFDVLVTDMKMPQMSGIELLERVVEAYPQIARLVLSAHADEGMLQASLHLVHQCLTKPTDAETLKAAITRACMVQQTTRNEWARKLVGICDALPTLPALYVEIMEVMRSPTAAARDIANAIVRDMAVAAKLLQLVNSSFFGVGRRVSNVAQAVSLLGVLRIKALLLCQQVFYQFKVSRSFPGFSIENLWNHSLRVGEVARLVSLAEGQKDDRPDQAFTAGLLHDLGVLVIASKAGDRFRTMLEMAACDPRPIVEIEKEVMGVAHPEIGACLLGLWGLPPRIVEAVALHHSPNELQYNGLCAATCVHVADALSTSGSARCSKYHMGSYTPCLDMDYLTRIGLESHISAWRGVMDRLDAMPDTAELVAQSGG